MRSVRSSGALTQFVEQPRVLDGDDGLGGEVLHQFDLLVRERANFLPDEHDRADDFAFLEHRYRQHGAIAAKLNGRHCYRIAFDVRALSRDVGSLRGPLGRYGTAESDMRTGPPRLARKNSANGCSALSIATVR